MSFKRILYLTLGVTGNFGIIEAKLARQSCLNYLCDQMKEATGMKLDLQNIGLSEVNKVNIYSDGQLFGIPPFLIPKGKLFAFEECLSKTTCSFPTQCVLF